MQRGLMILVTVVVAGCQGRLGAPPEQAPPDAGALDLGPTDAGPLDAGPLDAGPLDAGPLDAGCVFRLEIGPARHFPGLGAAQGLEVRDGRVYLFGDASTGIIKEGAPVDAGFDPTGREVLLTVDGGDRIPHPTGVTTADALPVFAGNTVGGVGTIFLLDWDVMWSAGTLDGAVLHVIDDDAAVNGTRPEMVRWQGAPYVATSDYGRTGNEVRLYDPVALATATATSEPGVVAARFPVGPFVQSLHFLEAEGALVLVQNTGNGIGWRLTVLDLEASIAAGAARVRAVFEPALPGELEGFALFEGRALFLTVGSPNLRQGSFACE